MNGLAIAGLLLSTASGAVLLGQDITDGRRRTRKQQVIANATTALEAREQGLRDHIAALQELNRNEGRPENHRVDDLTEPDQRHVEEARVALRALTDPHKIVLEDLTPLSRFWAYLFMVGGFFLQLASEVVTRECSGTLN
jgi:hypothetical protein